MNNEHVKNSHCSYCGARFTEQKLWPRRCFICYNDTWSNPIPVVALLIPVARFRNGVEEYGLLIQQRGIEPKKEEWALAGGYIDAGEDWIEAGVREAKEELGLDINPNELKLFDVTSSSKKDNILICGVTGVFDWEGSDSPGLEDFLLSFLPNEEVMEVQVMWEPRELAFPAHTKWVADFLNSKNKR